MLRRGRLALAIAAALALGGTRLPAQDPAETAPVTFSTGVKVVNVFVTARDKKGGIVSDLAKDDFTLFEDGRTQTIRYFSRESDLPLTIGLIVDMTPSESNMLETERNTSRVFLEKMLRPEKDQAFVVQFDSGIRMLQSLTSSREKLEAALNRLEVLQSGGNPGATLLSDSISLSAVKVLQSRSGRKALIVMGDGDHIGNHQQDAIAAAQQADTLVYAIRIYDREFGGGGGRGGGLRIGLGGPGMGGPGMGGPGGGGPGGPGGGGPGGPGGGGDSRDGKALKEIATRTGGGYFEVSKKLTLEDIYAKIEEELRNQYSLGYTSDGATQNGYRHIKVTTKRKGVVVQGREGYYAGKTT